MADDNRIALLEAALRWMILIAESNSAVGEDERKLRLRRAKQLLPFDYPEHKIGAANGGRKPGSKNKPKSAVQPTTKLPDWRLDNEKPDDDTFK